MSIEIVAFLLAALAGAGSVTVTELACQLLAAQDQEQEDEAMSQIRCSRLKAAQDLRLDPAQMARMLAAMGIEVQQGSQVSNIYGVSAQADLIITKWQGQGVPTNQLGLKRQANGSWQFLSGVGGIAQLAVGRVKSSIEQGLQTAHMVHEALQGAPEFRLVEQEGKQYATLTLASHASVKTDPTELTVAEQQAKVDEALRLVKGVAETTGLKAVRLDKPDTQVAPGTVPGLALKLPSGQLAGIRQSAGKLELVAASPNETVQDELRVVAERVAETQKWELTLTKLAAETQDRIELKALPLVKGLTAEQVVETLCSDAAREALGLETVRLGASDTLYPGTIPGFVFQTRSGELVALRTDRDGRVELVAPKTAEGELVLTRAALNAQGTIRQAQNDPRLKGLALDWSSLRVEEGEVVLDFVDKGAITAPRTAQLGNLKQVIVGGGR